MVIALVAGCGSCESSPPPAAEAGPSCTDDGELHGGDGTYYDADGTGNCSFDPSPGDLLVGAMNATDYAGSASCGACVAVTGPRGAVTVRIVDQCPGCAAGDIDLSLSAFDAIAERAAGRVPISWRYVPCEVAGSMRYHFKDGSNASWVAIQVRNHRYAIDGLEARAGDGGFHPLTRATYNYFVAEGGLGAGPFELRITDARGQTVEDPGIALADAAEVLGGAQLDRCAP